jgi:hypothetical protein
MVGFKNCRVKIGDSGTAGGDYRYRRPGCKCPSQSGKPQASLVKPNRDCYFAGVCQLAERDGECLRPGTGSEIKVFYSQCNQMSGEAGCEKL